MRHCNSVFSANDIWFLLDKDNYTNRRIYLAKCPICNKNIALLSFMDTNTNTFIEQYFYSGGVTRIKEKYKKDVVSTMLGFKYKYKAPSGFKYGINKEIKKNGKIIALKQYACDFSGNKALVKKIDVWKMKIK